MPSEPAGPARLARLARRSDLAVVDGPERAVVLDLDRPEEPPVVLEGSGQQVWDAFRVPRTVDEVVAELAGRYAEAAGAVAPGVREFVDSLLARGLLVEA